MTTLQNDAQLNAIYTCKELIDLIERKASIFMNGNPYDYSMTDILPRNWKRLRKAELIQQVRNMDKLLANNAENFSGLATSMEELEASTTEGVACAEFVNTTEESAVLPVYIIHDNVYSTEAEANLYDDGKDVPRLRYAIVEPNETIEYGIQCDFSLYASQTEAEEQIAEDASL